VFFITFTLSKASCFINFYLLLLILIFLNEALFGLTSDEIKVLELYFFIICSGVD